MTYDEYLDALAEATTPMENDPDPSTPEGTRLLELAGILESYERENFGI